MCFACMAMYMMATAHLGTSIAQALWRFNDTQNALYQGRLCLGLIDPAHRNHLCPDVVAMVLPDNEVVESEIPPILLSITVIESL